MTDSRDDVAADELQSRGRRRAATAVGAGLGLMALSAGRAEAQLVAGSDAIRPAAWIGTTSVPGELRSLIGEPGTYAVAGGFWWSGDGGGGLFAWDAENRDQDDGGRVIVPAGAGGGCWRRMADTDVYDVRHYGAVGDGAADDTLAVGRAIDAIERLAAGRTDYASNGAVLYFPRGTYRLSATLRIRRAMRIRGEIASNWGSTTYLRWPTGMHGIVLQGTGVLTSNRADGTIIEGLNIQGGARGPWTALSAAELDDPLTSPETQGHEERLGCGICVHAFGVKIRNCVLAGWEYDAIHVEGITSSKNANGVQIDDCVISACGRHGVFLAGENANAGTVQRILGTGALNGYTIYDRSFLGNTFVACHSEGARRSYYTADGGVANCTFVGCYQESSDGPAQLGVGTLVLGGTWGNGVAGRATVLAGIPGRGMRLHSGVVGGVLKPPLRRIVRDSARPPTEQPVYNVLASDHTILVDAAAGHCVVLLPDPVGAPGAQFAVKRVDSSGYAVWLQTVNGRLIDGGPRFTPEPGEGVVVQSDGTQFWATARYL